MRTVRCALRKRQGFNCLSFQPAMLIKPLQPSMQRMPDFCPMLSVTAALQLIREHTALLPPANVSLRTAAGLVLAADVQAPTSLPAFNQSAMDGYAFRFADLQKSSTLSAVGEVAAGDYLASAFNSGEAVRIFTGAAVPPEMDTVVMQEKVAVDGKQIKVLDESLKQGSNVRCTGDEIRQGELALPKDTVLTPAAIGFLAGLGVTDVTVYPKPTVHLIITGKELQKPGTALAPGQVYESNSVMLETALEQLHVTTHETFFCGDDLEQLASTLANSLQHAHLVLLTGGVSVGDYDFVVRAAGACGVQPLFHKLKQRPGKPLYAGTKEGKIVFGLPGNPASVLTCFYYYVVTALECLTCRGALLERRLLPLRSDVEKKVPLTQFLKAAVSPEGVMPLQAQESFRLSSFAVANALIILPEEARLYSKGENVEVLLLPYL